MDNSDSNQKANVEEDEAIADIKKKLGVGQCQSFIIDRMEWNLKIMKLIHI